MLPGEDDRRSGHDEDDFDHEEPRGWSKPDLPKSELEPTWGVENATGSVPESSPEQWGGRAGSNGDDTKNEPPPVQVPVAEKTVKSRR